MRITLAYTRAGEVDSTSFRTKTDNWHDACAEADSYVQNLIYHGWDILTLQIVPAND